MGVGAGRESDVGYLRALKSSDSNSMSWQLFVLLTAVKQGGTESRLLDSFRVFYHLWSFLYL